jgi:hypothetical protein
MSFFGFTPKDKNIIKGSRMPSFGEGIGLAWNGARDFFQILCSFFFDGVNNFFNIDSALIPLATTTKGTWLISLNVIDATPTAIEKIVVFGNTSLVTFIQVEIFTDGKVRFRLFDNAVEKFRVQTDGVAFLDNSWNTIGVVQDAILPFITINGIKVAQTLTVGTAPTQVLWFNDLPSLDNGRIGCLNGAGGGDVLFFNGYINQVSLLNDSITEAQILDWHNNGKPKDAETLFPNKIVYPFNPNNSNDTAQFLVPYWKNETAANIGKSFYFDAINNTLDLDIQSNYSNYMNGSGKEFTLMFNLLKARNGTTEYLMSQWGGSAGSNQAFYCYIDSAGRIGMAIQNSSGSTKSIRTTATFTDLSEPLRIMFSVNMNETLGNRGKIIVNGVDEVLDFDNLDTSMDTVIRPIQIGRLFPGVFGNFYLNEMGLLDEAVDLDRYNEWYQSDNPLNFQTVYGSNCKNHMNPEDSTLTAQFDINDVTNSCNWSSTNMVTSDLTRISTYGIIAVSENMVDADKDCTENPYE